MAIQQQFPNVHWIWRGGISFVYEVHPRIVVKVPKSGEFEIEQFRKEIKIYEIFSQHPPCPSVVQCFFYADNGIFLEYMRDVTLCSRIQNNHIRDPQTSVVTKVERLEPLSLRKEWMNDLAHAVAFLESLNLAHGDLRPENILLDRNRIKLSDFDCTAEIGTDFDACMPCMEGYSTATSRIKDDVEVPAYWFALGSLFYLINYGFEVYGDRSLTEDPMEHGPKVVDLLQNMEFPKLDGDPLIDQIIRKCWHNKYATISELAAYTETILPGRTSGRETSIETIPNPQWWMVIGRVTFGIWSSFTSSLALVLSRICESTKFEVANGEELDGHRCEAGENCSLGDFSSRKAFCQDLEKRGLLHLLSSGEPEHLGFTLEWYRHSR
ncbi:hypothetical protein N7488_006903 [Penicillium malachiteum]|nr:hypothetical protein N7488_006903 [Penicillium malachiteum]